MDYGEIISESIEYSRDALAGNRATWLIFIICSLPMALIQFLFDPEKLVDKTTAAFHWEIIPWPQVIGLCVAGFLLSFILSGYIVRVYRGTTPPPVFDRWDSLYLDGIKLMIVSIIWFIPALIVFAISVGLLFLGLAGDKPSMVYALAALVFLLAAFVLMVVAGLFSTLGVIRFARTGSIREGVRYSAIAETIGGIGWVVYIIALIVLFLVGIIFSIAVMVLAIIPFIGWILVLVVNPFMQVLEARYISRVYDHGAPPVPVAVPATP